MNEQKIKSYLGFSIKSGECIFGQDMLKSAKKRVYLIMLCPTATENLFDLANRIAVKQNCQFIKLDTKLDDLISKQNCKIVGITNRNLADAIQKNYN